MHGLRQGVRTITAQVLVEVLEAPDEIDDIAPGMGTACRTAKMRTATEGPFLVNQAS